MQFKGSLSSVSFDLAGYKAALHETFSRVVAESARSWLDATVNLIPTWSGASRSTFVPLASLVNFTALSITPTAARTRFSLGLENATGSVEADIGTGRYTFTYGTTLEYLIWNEFHNANLNPDPTLFGQLINPGPYNFQQAGQDAFTRFAQTVTLPDASPFIKSKPVRIG